MNPTYYQVLGVARTASQAEIKAAFKALAIRFHPDKHGGSSVYEARFKQVNEAYQVLSDARKKQLYDLKLNYGAARPTNFGATSPYQAAGNFRQPGTSYSASGSGPTSGYRYSPPPPPPRPAHAPPKAAAKAKMRHLTLRDYGIIAMVFICLIGFGLVLKFTMDHITAVDNYETAVEYMEQQRYTEAHDLLLQAVLFKPAYGEAYLKMADIELVVFKSPKVAQNNYSAAFANLAQVPAESYYMRAKTYLQTGNYNLAHEDLSKAIQLDSTIALASLDRGIIRLHNLGKAEASIPDFSRYLTFGTDTLLQSQAYQFRGYARHLSGSFAASEADFRKSLKIDPRNPITYSLLADLKVSMRDKASACSYYAIAYNLGDRTIESSLRKYCGGE